MSSTILVDVFFPALIGEDVAVPMIVTTKQTYTEEQVSGSFAEMALDVAKVINIEDQRFKTAEIVMDGFMATLVVDISTPDEPKPKYVPHKINPVCLLTEAQEDDLTHLIEPTSLVES